jgi:hypothetical protein
MLVKDSQTYQSNFPVTNVAQAGLIYTVINTENYEKTWHHGTFLEVYIDHHVMHVM